MCRSYSLAPLLEIVIWNWSTETENLNLCVFIFMLEIFCLVLREMWLYEAQNRPFTLNVFFCYEYLTLQETKLNHQYGFLEATCKCLPWQRPPKQLFNLFLKCVVSRKIQCRKWPSDNNLCNSIWSNCQMVWRHIHPKHQRRGKLVVTQWQIIISGHYSASNSLSISQAIYVSSYIANLSTPIT